MKRPNFQAVQLRSMPDTASQPYRGKRLFDITIALLSLLVLAPLFIVISFAIWFNDGLPILYRARRVGKGAQPFEMYKFRTMARDAHARGPHITLASDPRISKVGRLLRRSKVDELPQLFNVLRGDMSMVGPRPEDPHYTALYSAAQRQVLQTLPGITSIASIHYIHEQRLLSGPGWENTYINEVLPAKIALELEYLPHASIYTDMLVIFHTIVLVLRSGITLL